MAKGERVPRFKGDEQAAAGPFHGLYAWNIGRRDFSVGKRAGDFQTIARQQRIGDAEIRRFFHVK